MTKKKPNRRREKPFQSPSNHKETIHNKTIHQLRYMTIPYFRKKRVPLTTRQIPPVLIEPFPRTSLVAPNLHPLTNPKEEFRLLFRFALNFGENLWILKIHRTVAAMVEVLCNARIVLSTTNISGMFLHPLIFSSNSVAHVRIFRRRIARAVKLVDDL